MDFLHNKFQIIKRLSDTCIFEVYLAKDTVSDKNVSVYKVKQAYMEDLSFVKGLTQGIIDCRDLNHPNTLRFIDVDSDEETESIAFIYEYADGVSLKEIFSRQPKLSLQKSIEIAINVLQSLDNAHLMGICHGDLYADDIFITQDGHIKVRGYGRKDGIEVSSVAKEHLSLETIKYQSPEILEGQGLYEASDVYSVGICLYKMLTGQLPFEGNTSVEIATKIIRDIPISPRLINRELSASLSSLLLESISKEYSSRVGTASLFISRLTDVQRSYKQGEYSRPSETVVIKHEEEEKKQSKMPLMITLFIVVVLLATCITMAYVNGQKTKVPNLVGLTEEDAISKLQGLKIGFDKGEDIYSEDLVAGIVADQSPKAGDKIGKGEKITYMLSKGQENTRMPYIIGLDYEQAKEKLAKGNFEIEIREEYSNSVPDGTVLNTMPEANTELPNGSHVTITISKGGSNSNPYSFEKDKKEDTSSYDGEYKGEERESYSYNEPQEEERSYEKPKTRRHVSKDDNLNKTEKKENKKEEKPTQEKKKEKTSYSSSSSDVDATVNFND